VVRRSPAAFVRDHTRLTRVGFVPEIQLYLAVDDAVDLWEVTQESGDVDGGDPPFWAFAWAGGLALARYLLDNPQVVAGRRVVDVATGSGLVAVAAALAGAGEVAAVDVDELAVVAARRNAEANGVRLSVTVASVTEVTAGPGDLVLAGDVFYDAAMAEQMITSLRVLRSCGAEVLIGDPYRSRLPQDALSPLATYEVDVDPELERANVVPAVVARLTG
jgi:predicted nicotinamide N-methyase